MVGCMFFSDPQGEDDCESVGIHGGIQGGSGEGLSG